MESKPEGTYRCVACGKTWDGSQLYLDPLFTAIRWTCGNLCCGGTVQQIPASRGKKGTDTLPN